MPTRPKRPAKKAAVKKTAAAPAGPRVDTIDERDLAAQYGWALSVLKSSPDLKKLFDQAVKETWTGPRFVAELRSTNWFKKNSEAMRNATVLRTTDPRTWTAMQNKTRASVRDMAVALGAQVSDETLRKITDNVLNYGWNDAQIKDTLAGAVKMGAAGTYGGQAAVNAEQLRETAMNNGVKLNDANLRGWLVRIAAGEDPVGFQAYVKDMAKGAFPAFADKIDAGMNVKDIASPYINQMANTLELNEQEIDLFDPTVRKTLQHQDAAGQHVSKPLWQFEQELRKDPRWMETKGARKDIMGKAESVLKDFGLTT